MNIFFKKDIYVFEGPFKEGDIIQLIKAGEKIEYNRIIKIDNSKWIVVKNGYIFVEENYIQEKGEYMIETYLEKNRVLALEGTSLKINIMNEQYFYFKPINNEDYLICLHNSILGIGQTKDGDLSIKTYNPNDNLDDSKKWNLIRITENIYKIKNKFFGYFFDVPRGNAQIGTKILLSSKNDSNSQYFYLWKKDNPYELHISLPFDIITNRIIERKSMLRYLEIDNYIDKIEYNFGECLFLEKINCCCKHLKYFKDVDLKEIIIREDDTHLKKEDFMYFTNLISLTLPLSLYYIDDNTFIDMKNLNKINGDLKWYKYFNIKEIKIPEGEKKLKREIFYRWKSLEKVY